MRGERGVQEERKGGNLKRRINPTQRSQMRRLHETISNELRRTKEREGEREEGHKEREKVK